MAGATIDIDDLAVKTKLQQLQDKVGNLEPVFADIGEYLLLSTDNRFNAQTDPDGHEWAKLSDAYLAEKPYNQDKILTLDGGLQEELQSQITGQELFFGTNKIYGATHQFGRDGIRARPFLGVSGDDKKEILARIARHINDAV